jgi:hypothetical protein
LIHETGRVFRVLALDNPMLSYLTTAVKWNVAQWHDGSYATTGTAVLHTHAQACRSKPKFRRNVAIGHQFGKADWNRIVAELQHGLHAPKETTWVKIKNPPYS